MRVDIDKIRQEIRDKDMGEEIDEAPRRYRRRRPKRKFRIFRFCGCWIAVLFLIIAIVVITVKLVVGPVVQSTGELPSNFPKDFAILDYEVANIKIQTPESRQKLLYFIQAMPDWMAVPFWGYLSDNVKEKFVNNFDQSLKVPEDFNFSDFKEMLSNSDLANTNTVSLAWDKIGKTKEELLFFYKQELSEKGFGYKENLNDYEIDLGFWKDGVFGMMKFKDTEEDEQAEAEIMVNYMEGLKLIE
jgi:hypothetical protein